MQKYLLLGLLMVKPLLANFGVVPIAMCATSDPFTNQMVVYWTANNTNTFEVTVDNSFNFFVPGPGNRTQPVSFPPGMPSQPLFTTISPLGASVTWVLGEFFATAQTGAGGTPACQFGAPQACWDLNRNGICDPNEDTNHDGVCDIRDCQGPAGPPGPSGLAGATGATGPQGATGSSLSGSSRLATTASTTVTAIAACNANEFMVSGGGACTVPGTTPSPGRIATSQAASLTSWTVTCSTGLATAAAICSVQQ
jgi:hypothetical protein